MIYRFRVLLDTDTDEDVFRDIELSQTATLEDFHNVITQSFGFDGSEMASFYTSDEQWSQNEEISMFDMGDGEEGETIRLMNETQLEDIVHEASPRLLYIYDFLSMWTFMIELADIGEPEAGQEYPNIMFVHGQVPENVQEINFETEDMHGEDEDAFSDSTIDLEDYDELDFDENWN